MSTTAFTTLPSLKVPGLMHSRERVSKAWDGAFPLASHSILLSPGDSDSRHSYFFSHNHKCLARLGSGGLCTGTSVLKTNTKMRLCDGSPHLLTHYLPLLGSPSKQYGSPLFSISVCRKPSCRRSWMQCSVHTRFSITPCGVELSLQVSLCSLWFTNCG